LTPEIVADAIQTEEILGRERVLARLQEIWSTYVANVGSPVVAEAKPLGPTNERDA